MVMPFDEIYEPDEILREDEDTFEDEQYEEELLELDFASPSTARRGLDDLLSEVETPDELFPIA